MAFEIPEAVTVARQLNKELKGKTIDDVRLSAACVALIEQGFINLHTVRLNGRKVDAITSLGKWINIHLEPEMYLLFALETGGKILYHTNQASLPDKYHVRIDFNDRSFLTEQISGWGWAKGMLSEELETNRYPGHPGLCPLDEAAFTFPAFKRILAEDGSKITRQVLLDQNKIAGIGNGYLQDILFKAHIHPKRKVGSLNEEEQLRLYQAVCETLAEAVHLGGCEFSVDLYGRPGRYHRLMSEASKGQPCPRCSTLIEKISVLGGSCYICPKEQFI
jgi:formamidopyrimidine-DNA glycosylase